MSNKRKISCPACKTAFMVDSSKIPEKGCHANCKRCKNRFFIAGSASPETVSVPSKATASKPEKHENPALKQPVPVTVEPAAQAEPAKEEPVKQPAPVTVEPAAQAEPVKEEAVKQPAPVTVEPATQAESVNEEAEEQSAPATSEFPAQAEPANEEPVGQSALGKIELARHAEPVNGEPVIHSAPGKIELATQPESVNGEPVIQTATDEVESAAQAEPSNREPAIQSTPAQMMPAEAKVPVKPEAEKDGSFSQIKKLILKKNVALYAGAACVILLICVGAIFFLTQEDKRPSPQKRIPSTIKKPPAAAKPPAAVPEKKQSQKPPANRDSKIGDLFNQASPAVATVSTYDSENEFLMQGSGFFINQAGHFITNYHVLKGAFSVLIKVDDKTEYPVKSVLAEDEIKDLIMLAIDIPEGALEPGLWLTINDKQPGITDKIIVIGAPSESGLPVSDGTISAVREIPDMGLVFQMTASVSKRSSGSPVIDMNGRVVGVAFFQIEDGQNLNFIIPGENILALEQKQPLNIAEWTEKVKAENDEKSEEKSKPQSAEDILKAKLAYQIIQESGLAKQNQSFTEMILTLFEEKYRKTALPKTEEEDDKRFSKFKEVIRLATNPDRMNDYIKKHLASNLTIPELEHVQKWYATPLGKKISEIEYSSYTKKSEDIKTLRLAFRLTRYQTTSRSNLFARLDDTTSSTKTMVNLQTNLIVQNQILGLILSDSKKPDQASIDKIIQDFKTDIDPDLDIFTAQFVFAGFVYTYRGLSGDELEKYVVFSETTAAQRYYSLLNKISNRILLENHKRILTSMIRVLNNDSWDDIQKDLNRSIKE